MQNPSDTRRRVKVYQLNEDRQWDDGGTGHVQTSFDPATDICSLLVKSETDQGIALFIIFHPTDLKLCFKNRVKRPNFTRFGNSSRYKLFKTARNINCMVRGQFRFGTLIPRAYRL